MRLVPLDRGDFVIRRQAILSALDQIESRSDLRAEDVVRVVRQTLRNASVKAARYVLVGQFKGEAVPLPTDRLRYKNKRNDLRFAHANPIEFFRGVYNDLPKNGYVYANELGKIDPELLKGIRNYCRNHDLNLEDFVKPRETGAKPSQVKARPVRPNRSASRRATALAR